MDKELLLENKLLGELPEDILSAIEANRTPFGNNPSFPDIFDVPYLEKIAKISFEKAKNKLFDIGSIDDVDGNDLLSVHSQLINKCQEIERANRSELEKICYNIVVDAFRIPADTIELELEIKDKIDLADSSIIIDPSDGDEFEMTDIGYAKLLKKEIYKRSVLNALCVGNALNIASSIDIYKDKISEINEELCPLYEKIFALNAYLLLSKNSVGIDDRNNMQAGMSVLYIGNDMNMSKIKAQGTIFPFLLYETVKSLSELFISHGLPKSLDLTRYILGKTDYIKAEPWNMRVGEELWSIFSEGETSTERIPYLLKTLSCISTKKFFKISNEILAKTKKGKQIQLNIAKRIARDFEYDDFVDRMDKMKEKNGIITDEFIRPDEL